LSSSLRRPGGRGTGPPRQAAHPPRTDLLTAQGPPCRPVTPHRRARRDASARVIASVSAAERQTLAPDGSCRIKPIRKRRCTLAEWGTRRILALLREPEHAAGSRPQPALAELQQLVADYREAGLPVRLEWTGQRQPLSGGIKFSVYRVVQEALMNVLKPGRPASLRARSSRGPRHAPDRRRREAADSGQPGIPFPARLVGEGIPRGRACHACVGRARAHLPLAPRDLQHQLDLPLLRPPAVRDQRPVHQRRLAVACHLRRVVAQQPPRVPTSAFHGLRGRELDIGDLFISALQAAGLAWQVVRIAPERQRERAAPGTA
jgi:hypothetical protein